MEHADAVACTHGVRVGEESIEENLHRHLWTVRCERCGFVTLVRTIGCNCKDRKGDQG